MWVHMQILCNVLTTLPPPPVRLNSSNITRWCMCKHTPPEECRAQQPTKSSKLLHQTKTWNKMHEYKTNCHKVLNYWIVWTDATWHNNAEQRAKPLSRPAESNQPSYRQESFICAQGIYSPMTNNWQPYTDHSSHRINRIVFEIHTLQTRSLKLTD